MEHPEQGIPFLYISEIDSVTTVAAALKLLPGDVLWRLGDWSSPEALKRAEADAKKPEEVGKLLSGSFMKAREITKKGPSASGGHSREQDSDLSHPDHPQRPFRDANQHSIGASGPLSENFRQVYRFRRRPSRGGAVSEVAKYRLGSRSGIATGSQETRYARGIAIIDVAKP
jgi:hypothetical protein